MEIAKARVKAEAYLSDHLIQSGAKRPPVGAAVMARWPENNGQLITADNADELREKLAKRIQAVERRKSH